ncbi:MAG: hypothetical protein MSD59_02085 [Parabacteroides merdae]|uniref:hypothetical protein n=1 Tax=Parabacteroides merdae TaxID=46503 RepID=UPI00356815B3|nr:hypothetical protein [Parabacteroides merdae]
MYNVKTSIPTIVLITKAKLHDVNILDELNYEKGSFYIMDKGYVDFTRYISITPMVLTSLHVQRII